MRKIVLVYGTIAGVLMDLLFFISFWMMDKGYLTHDSSELFGYTTMIIVLSFIFVGVRSYRNDHLGGVMTFGKGLTAGLLIAAVASLFYAGGWEIYYNTVPNVKEKFIQQYADAVVKKMEEKGEPKEKIEAKRTELTQMAEMYKNPLIRFGMTLAEILPVGIGVSLISAGILRKKAVLPA